MAQCAHRLWYSASAVTRRSWFLLVVSVVLLLALAAVLAVVAWRYYKVTPPNTFRSVLASNLLQVAVITIGGLVIVALLGLIQELQAKRERDMAKRLELFRRMRAAHVRIVRAQRLLRGDGSPETYGKQLRALMAVARDLEEVREEIKISGNLYKDDRCSIMWGIAIIIEFLEKGSVEYINWCNGTSGLKGEPRSNDWVAKLIEVHKSPEPVIDLFNEKWALNDMMPEDYECGLTKSKLKMREYVYGNADDAGERSGGGAKSSAGRHGTDRAGPP